MYENLWLLYNKTAFDNCDVSLDPNRKRLLTCNTPALLNYISVQFARFTADPDGLMFEGGRSYYFIGKCWLVLLKLINNSSRENKENRYRDRGLDMWS